MVYFKNTAVLCNYRLVALDGQIEESAQPLGIVPLLNGGDVRSFTNRETCISGFIKEVTIFTAFSDEQYVRVN